MPSAALHEWDTNRRKRLAELVLARSLMAPAGPGRKWTTGQINAALLVRLASEFQGFARDLHDEASECFAQRTSPANLPLRSIVQTRLTQGRQIDSKNAQPSSLGSDFNRLGIDLWPDLARGFRWAKRQQKVLEKLNEVRNGIVHDDRPALATLHGQGFGVTLVTYRVCQTNLDGLARNLDTLLSDHLAALFNSTKPW